MIPPESRNPRDLSLSDRAAADLSFVRSAMENGGRFSAVPGWGAVFMGTVGFAAAGVASLAESPKSWLVTWLIAAAVAATLGGFAMERKASRKQLPLTGRLGRKFFLGLCPALVAGAFLTLLLYRADQHALLPATWLLLYGAGTIACGAFSIPPVPIAGGLFLGLGVLATFLPADLGNLLLAVGFGGVHWLFGLYIARRHGG